MTTPRAMTGISATQDELKDFFENHANIAFDLCWDAHCKVDFYAKLLADIKKGLVLSDELPEAKGLSTSVTKVIIQKQHKQAIAAAESAWELSGDIAREFRTTIRSALPEGESIPQYDIEYQAKNTREPARVRIKTWRRNISVELIGSESALDELHGLVTLAALRET
jgi:hypothetical protein